MREVEHISIVSDEMREVVEELWPECKPSALVGQNELIA